MSRRDSDSRHHRSRFDRDPSPKRVKRDRKTATEQTNSNLNLNPANRDKKHHSVVPDSKKEIVSFSKESDKKNSIKYREATKNSSDNTEVPRSRSHFQHDGHTSRHKEPKERGWWKDSKSGRPTIRNSNNDDTKPRYNEQIPKKRPSFRETKIVTQIPVNGERKEEREKPRNRNAGGLFRARGRSNGQQGQGGGQADKWKHDLYDEGNKSPKSKNEEDQIAKVEALLAS